VSIIAWLVVGAIAGYVANYLLGTRSGLISTVVFGIVGGIVGGLIGGYITAGKFDLTPLMNGFDLTSIIVAILGALGLGIVGAWWAKRGTV
jgi:uncharacterized membrane protein YeaQ/YmgE (transglycosylase-associated protein family)